MRKMSGKKTLCTICNVSKSYEKKAAPVLGPLNLSIYENEMIWTKWKPAF